MRESIRLNLMASSSSWIRTFVAILCAVSTTSTQLASRDNASIELGPDGITDVGPGNIAPGLQQRQSAETYAKRDYFFVGGQYEQGDSVANGTIRSGQLYVERLIPACDELRPYPLVFWHGGVQTGTNFLNTPDGRTGWASYFLSKGFIVYIIDQPQRGRSFWEQSDGKVAYYNVEQVESVFTAPQDFQLYPLSVFHTQWPGTGRQGDPIFDGFYASQVQFQGNSTISEDNNRKAGAALFDRIGKGILVTHSQSGPYGWGIADLRPDLVQGVLAIEPEGPPFTNALIQGNSPARPYGVTTLPITYDPPVTNPATDLTHQTFPPTGVNLTSCIRQAEPARRLVNLAKVPVMMLSSQASYHSAYDYCTAAYLQQAGVQVDFVNLTSHGITGNGHFMFVEKNSLDIAPFAEGFFDFVSLH